MSEFCENDIRADRIYLPAYENDKESRGVPLDKEIRNYINREFPLPPQESNTSVCYSIPKVFVPHGEPQGCKAELISFERFSGVQLPQDTPGAVWQACFQGICYAGKSYRNTRDGRFIRREHDLVVFNIFEGKYYVSLIEIKSTCDDPAKGKVSDSNGIKNNKRSGQHQLRDHLEILQHVTKDSLENLNKFMFWPFLSMWTNDPRGNRVKRWEGDKDQQHVFTNTFDSQESFNEWFYQIVLRGKPIEKRFFDMLFRRFIVLSCGIFVDEIHKGMLALLSQQQVNLFYRKPTMDGAATVVHGAAGTGKTLLVFHKLKYLYECGLLNSKNRALYICYWQGIRTEFRQKLVKSNLHEYVDTVIFHITQEGFLKYNKKKYRHIFMDECEAICLSFSEKILRETFENIERCRMVDYDEDFSYRQRYYTDETNNDSCPYRIQNDEIVREDRNTPLYSFGDLWYLFDNNQTTIFIPKYSPKMLTQPDIVLTKIVRNTGTIYKVFSQFYNNPTPLSSKEAITKNIKVGHNICGPPIYWIDSDKFSNEPLAPEILTSRSFNGFIKGIIDLYSCKGITPRDMCVLPFLVSSLYLEDNINKAIDTLFSGYRPAATSDVVEFVASSDENQFLVPWVLRVKGLEFKVVVIVIDDDDDFNYMDTEDRRKVYIMASRCTCLLILVSNKSVKDTIDVYKVIKAYPFGEEMSIS